ncbi:unnamed protein product [Polarella glacialis]|uniref:Transmembrane protein n=1 Tax=Polarella glacialis TaxID=89957 RepID=A0A813LL10_POLGL|nr:unnamed protein product [Polarella glacialis]CAE8732084.1 unnamed protein product [Polarella glacialis]
MEAFAWRTILATTTTAAPTTTTTETTTTTSSTANRPAQASTVSPTRCWQSFFESGMLSPILFLVAMFMYDAAWFLDAKSLATAALFVVSSALFVAEAFADIAWSLHARAVDARDPLVDKRVELELLGAVLFLMASLFALLSSIADERIANFGGGTLQNVCLWASPVLYFVDSLVILAGRWREVAQTPKTLRAPLLFLETSQSCLFCVDWLTWGAALFCAGALLDIGDQAWPDNPWGLNFAVSDVLWTLDALIYMFVSQGSWRLSKDDAADDDDDDDDDDLDATRRPCCLQPARLHAGV